MLAESSASSQLTKGDQCRRGTCRLQLSLNLRLESVAFLNLDGRARKNEAVGRVGYFFFLVY